MVAGVAGAAPAGLAVQAIEPNGQVIIRTLCGVSAALAAGRVSARKIVGRQPITAGTQRLQTRCGSRSAPLGTAVVPAGPGTVQYLDETGTETRLLVFPPVVPLLGPPMRI